MAVMPGTLGPGVIPFSQAAVGHVLRGHAFFRCPIDQAGVPVGGFPISTPPGGSCALEGHPVTPRCRASSPQTVLA